ncbi:Rv1733c family protein [Streptomyces broussonetiae]|uniref:Uncharacterized protein n=1 Tax=Streptomyces broussonetiae TaxID=2686304 RepID=A0ABV5EE68_9ACTN
MAFRGPGVTRVRLWRWRRNPLRRRADVVEGWVLLGAWLLTVVVGVLVGLAATHTVERQLARERDEWRPTTAHLAEAVPGGHREAGAGERVWSEVRWTGPDGVVHTGQVRVRPGSPEGAPVTVWTDRRGRLVTEPATEVQARVNSALVGGLAGLSAAAVPCLAGRALRCRLEQARLDRWDTDWARFDPLWGHRTG